MELPRSERATHRIGRCGRALDPAAGIATLSARQELAAVLAQLDRAAAAQDGGIAIAGLALAGLWLGAEGPTSSSVQVPPSSAQSRRISTSSKHWTRTSPSQRSPLGALYQVLVAP